MQDVRRDWFSRISGRLRAVVRRRVAEQVVRRPEEWDVASDVTHDAFLTAAERFGEFRGTTEAELVAWVSAIAENKLCDHRRAVRRKRRDVRRTCSLGACGEAVSDETATPDEMVLRDEELRWVLELVDRLPSRYRTAIRLRYLDGQPVAYVAASLQCSEAAAQGVLKRALAWLRRISQESEPTDGAAIRSSREP